MLLTVPYLRVPLLLGFVRPRSEVLLSAQMRALVTRALFQPLPSGARPDQSDAPAASASSASADSGPLGAGVVRILEEKLGVLSLVPVLPAARRDALSAHIGLLQVRSHGNGGFAAAGARQGSPHPYSSRLAQLELTNCPEPVLSPLVSIVQDCLGAARAGGGARGAPLDALLWVLRVASAVEGAAVAVASRGSCHSDLAAGLRRLRVLLRGSVMGMLLAALAHARRESQSQPAGAGERLAPVESAGSSSSASAATSGGTAWPAVLHAHILLVWAHARDGDDVGGLAPAGITEAALTGCGFARVLNSSAYLAAHAGPVVAAAAGAADTEAAAADLAAVGWQDAFSVALRLRAPIVAWIETLRSGQRVTLLDGDANAADVVLSYAVGVALHTPVEGGFSVEQVFQWRPFAVDRHTTVDMSRSLLLTGVLLGGVPPVQLPAGIAYNEDYYDAVLATASYRGVAPMCEFVASTEQCLSVRIIHGGRTFDVAHWKPLLANAPVLSAGACAKAAADAVARHEHVRPSPPSAVYLAHGWPRWVAVAARIGGGLGRDELNKVLASRGRAPASAGVAYAGQIYWTIYARGSGALGPAGRMLDSALNEALGLVTEAGSVSQTPLEKLDKKRCFVLLRDSPAAALSSTGCEGAPAALVWLPGDDSSDDKASVGTWLEIVVDDGNGGFLLVSQLNLLGRLAQRTIVWTSDARRCCRALQVCVCCVRGHSRCSLGARVQPSLLPRGFPWTENCEWAAGSLFGTFPSCPPPISDAQGKRSLQVCAKGGASLILIDESVTLMLGEQRRRIRTSRCSSQQWSWCDWRVSRYSAHCCPAPTRGCRTNARDLCSTARSAGPAP